MKYSNYIGVAACVLLIISCTMHWAYYPDLDKYFTGFNSEKNIYGKPGKVMVFFAVVSIVLYLIQKVWAKRMNWLITALAFSFGIKTFITFTSCYRGTCPVKQEGIFLMVGSTLIMIVAALTPKLELKVDKNDN